MSAAPILYLVIPCYNEEAVLPEAARRMRLKMTAMVQAGTIGAESRIVFVDDGSRDQTWPLIAGLHAQDPLFAGIRLSRNRGHQQALLAGLLTVRDRCAVTISLDADLQDDIDVLDQFMTAHARGADIVYGVRSSRQSDHAIKRWTAVAFYRLMRLMGVDLVFNHADYRLMSSRALAGLSEFREVNLFLRGLVPMIGYPTATVTYERHERYAGESKYPFSKMVALAIDGITSLSIKPIRMITTMGFGIFLTSLVILFYSLFARMTGRTVAGWTSLIVSIWAIGGLQLLSLGIIGEYIGKIYLESKQRPRFIIDRVLLADGPAATVDSPTDGPQATADSPAGSAQQDPG